MMVVKEESPSAECHRPNALCSECTRLVCWTKEPNRATDDYLKFKFKPHLEQIRISALRCPFCDFVLHKVFQNRHLEEVGEEMASPPCMVTVVPFGDPRLGLFEVSWEEKLPFPVNIKHTVVFFLASTSLAGKRAVWKGSVQTFDARLQTALEWLSDCDCHHDECVEEDPPPLPSRLLDLSLLEQSGTVSLIESCTLETRTARYATLSHRWGPLSSAPPIKTTKSNYADHLQGIKLTQMTLNFHDAILICRMIGLDYLWIDALCIIQDDSHDWQKEAANMANVYRGGYVNIAANAAEDAHGGIIGLTALRDPKDRVSVVRYSQPSTASDATNPPQDSPVAETLLLQQNYGQQENKKRRVHEYPYLDRGWVFQELALSPRTLHLMRGQMFWQCRQCFTSEDGTVWGKAFDSLFEATQVGSTLDFSTPAASHVTWSWWMKSYASRAFTYHADVGPAMAGMIQYFQLKTGWQPMLGLWRETLAFDLAWSQHHSLTREEPPTNAFPSWSWLSVVPLGESRRALIGISWVEECVIPLRLECWEEKWEGVPFTSKLESSKLVVSALTRDLTIHVGQNSDSLVGGNRDDWRQSGASYDLQYVEPTVMDVDVKLVQLYQAIHCYGESTALVDYFLILRPSRDRPGCYSRIGSGDATLVVAEEWEGKHCEVHFMESSRELIEIV